MHLVIPRNISPVGKWGRRSKEPTEEGRGCPEALGPGRPPRAWEDLPRSQHPTELQGMPPIFFQVTRTVPGDPRTERKKSGRSKAFLTFFFLKAGCLSRKPKIKSFGEKGGKIHTLKHNILFSRLLSHQPTASHPSTVRPSVCLSPPLFLPPSTY